MNFRVASFWEGRQLAFIPLFAAGEAACQRRREVAPSRSVSCVALRAIALAAALLWFTCPANAEYRLQAGDVLEVSVAGAPELRQRAAVQLDGSLMLPMVGTLAVEGSPFSEVRSKIQSTMAGRIVRLRGPDGRELQRIFDLDEIAATIVEYKPVFVSGVVSRPGEQVFRARMTVRQAVASAGGLAQPAANATLFDALTLRSEYITVWSDLARGEARLWRIRMELGENVEFDQSAIPPSPVPESTASQILALEVEYRKARARDHELAKDFLLRSIGLADEQIKVLSEQKQKEEEGVLADTSDLQRIMNLYTHGSSTNLRVTDARRALLLSSTRQLQTATKLMDVRKSRSEAARELERIDDERRMRLLAELQDATAKVTVERAKLHSARDKLQLAGVKPPGYLDSADRVDFIVFRKGLNGQERLAAEADTELRPGDVVEVAMRLQRTDLDVAAR